MILIVKSRQAKFSLIEVVFRLVRNQLLLTCSEHSISHKVANTLLFDYVKNVSLFAESFVTFIVQFVLSFRFLTFLSAAAEVSTQV